MPELETLQCSHGHPFQRPRVRGRKPTTCPEHATPKVVVSRLQKPAQEPTEPKQRTLTDDHKQKLVQGRVQAAQSRIAMENDAARSWLTWLKSEAKAYHALTMAQQEISEQSVEEAYARWRMIASAQPILPNGAAITRVKEMA